MKTRLWFLPLLILATACGDDPPTDYRESCDETHRLALGGAVGSTRFEFAHIDPYQGRMGTNYFDLVLEEGEEPHIIVFSTAGVEGGDIRSHLQARIDSGAAGASTLNLATRPSDIPCEPLEGVLCATYGIDINNDGTIFGNAEVLYPVESGTITFSEVTGNELAASFSVVFGPQEEGPDELRGDQGGELDGCFRLFPSADISNVH